MANMYIKRIVSLLVLAGVLPLAQATEQPRVLNQYTLNGGLFNGGAYRQRYAINVSSTNRDAASANTAVNTATAAAETGNTAVETAQNAATTAANAVATAVNTQTTVSANVRNAAATAGNALPANAADRNAAQNTYLAAFNEYQTALNANNVTAALYTNLNAAAATLSLTDVTNNISELGTANTNVTTAQTANNTAAAAVNTAVASANTLNEALANAVTAANTASATYAAAIAAQNSFNGTAWGTQSAANTAVLENHSVNLRLFAIGAQAEIAALNSATTALATVARAHSNADVGAAYASYRGSLAAVYTSTANSEGTLINTARNTVDNAASTFRNHAVALNSATLVDNAFNSSANDALDAAFSTALAAVVANGSGYNEVAALVVAVDNLQRAGVTSSDLTTSAAALATAEISLASVAMVVAPEGTTETRAFVMSQEALAAAATAANVSQGTAYTNALFSALGSLSTDLGFSQLSANVRTGDDFAAARAQRTASLAAQAASSIATRAFDYAPNRAAVNALAAQAEIVQLRRTQEVANATTAAETANATLVNTTANLAAAVTNNEAATTNATAANTAHNTAVASQANALTAVVNHVTALSASDRAPYQTQLDTIADNTSTATEIATARNTIANTVSARITDTNITVTEALTTLSTAHGTAVTATSEALTARNTAGNELTAAGTALAAAMTANTNAGTAQETAVAAVATAQATLARVTYEFDSILSAERSSIGTLSALSEAFRGYSDFYSNNHSAARHNRGVALVDSIEAIHDAIAATEASYTTLVGEIDAVQTSQGNNTAAIAANTAAIANNAAALAVLGQTIEFMNAGVAGAIALSGTPRLVGKTQITVATGDFEGSSAIGFKIQGRVNDSLAYGIGYAQGDGGARGDASGTQIAITFGL